MTLTIHDTTMTSDRTAHTARQASSRRVQGTALWDRCSIRYTGRRHANAWSVITSH